MRINAINMLRQSSRLIDGYKGDDGSYSWMLGEFATALEQLRAGETTWEDFAETFCLTERDRGAA